ncbi:MAG: ATP-binding cassette domain-containing protein [Actinobacteria bacterium]|nr:ATP-binding cassette domain-containing protein [Actinomycetota bacterium]
MDTLFEFERVGVDGPQGPLVVDLSGRIPDAGVTAVVGPSGAGKSTLLRLCNRLEVPSRGRVRFRDVDVAGIDPLRLRRRVGLVAQRPTPFPGTVADNLRVALPEAGEEAMSAVLDRVQLDRAFLHRPATELSGGEAQRVCLARTLLTGPEALLMDEPTSSLDPQTRFALEALARAEARDGVPVVWVSHDLEQVARVADHVVVVVKGTIVHAGAARDFEPSSLPAEAVRFLTDTGEEAGQR